MADFSINYRLFIDPLGNEHGERKKIDGFLDLLSASGVAGVLSPRDGKAGRPGTGKATPDFPDGQERRREKEETAA